MDVSICFNFNPITCLTLPKFILDWVTFFDNHNGTVTAIITLVIAIATIYYALETIKLREAQTEPLVSIFLEQDHHNFGYINCVIQNFGLGPAKEIVFDVLHDIDYRENLKFSEIGIIRNGIKVLGPNKEKKIFLLSLWSDAESKLKLELIIKVTFKNISGKEKNYTYTLDFKEFEHLRKLPAPINDIKTSLESIKNDMHNLVEFVDKEKGILVFTQEYEKAVDERRKRYEEDNE